MPKQKTHKATSKVLKKHPSGLITYKRSNGNHKTAKDSSKQVRQRRGSSNLSKGTTDKLKNVI